MFVYCVLGFIAISLFVGFVVYLFYTWHQGRVPVSRLGGYPPVEPKGINFSTSMIYSIPRQNNNQNNNQQ